MTTHISRLLSFLIVFGFSAVANAQITRYEFTGTVTGLSDGNLYTIFDTVFGVTGGSGDPVTGFFEIDLAAAQTSYQAGSAYGEMAGYDMGALLTMSVTINGVTFQNDGVYRATVDHGFSDNPRRIVWDSFLIEDGIDTASSNPNLTGSTFLVDGVPQDGLFAIDFRTQSTNFFQSVSLPTNFAFASYTNVNATLVNAGDEIDFRLDSITRTSVSSQPPIVVSKIASGTRIKIDASSTGGSVVNIWELTDGRIQILADGELYYFTCPTTGPSAPDILFIGSDGDDVFLNQTSLMTSAFGKLGDDIIVANHGIAYLSGGDGDDTLLGGDFDDTIYGGAGVDLLRGQAGDDHLVAGEGDDLVRGESGDDTIYGGNGADRIIAGGGDDSIFAGAGRDFVVAGEGDDHISTGPDADNIFGNAGDDRIVATGVDNEIYGGPGDDTIVSTDTGSGTLHGGAGDDTITIGILGGRIIGGTGDDVLSGSVGDDQLFGGSGNDVLYGGGGNDLLSGGSGDDYLKGDARVGSVIESSDEDRILGGSGDDILLGGVGTDTLYGGLGNDLLCGGDEADYLNGNAGDDSLFGGEGVDDLIEGPGTDTVSQDGVCPSVTRP